jgi:hypothetical protein
MADEEDRAELILGDVQEQRDKTPSLAANADCRRVAWHGAG